jgi:hypothetical protein
MWPASGSGAGRFKRVGPPGDVVEQRAGGLREMGEILEALALLPDAKEFDPADVHGIAYRRHLKFDRDQPKLLDGARGTNSAIADEPDRLAGEFRKNVVECVLGTAL